MRQRNGRAKRQQGSYLVTGPLFERPALTVSHGIVLAQEYACRHKAGATYYVRDVLGTTTYATVTREEDGSVITIPAIAA